MQTTRYQRGFSMGILLVIVTLVIIGVAVYVITTQSKSLSVDEFSQSIDTLTENPLEVPEGSGTSTQEPGCGDACRITIVEPASGIFPASIEEPFEVIVQVGPASLWQDTQGALGTLRIFDDLGAPLMDAVALSRDESLPEGQYQASVMLTKEPRISSGYIEFRHADAESSLGSTQLITFAGSEDPSSLEGLSVTRCGIMVTSPSQGDLVSNTIEVTGYVDGCGWSPFEGTVGTVQLLAGVESPSELSEVAILQAQEGWLDVALADEPIAFSATVRVPTIPAQPGAYLYFKGSSPADGAMVPSFVLPVRLFSAAFKPQPLSQSLCGLTVTSPASGQHLTGTDVTVTGFVEGCGWGSFEGMTGTMQIFRGTELPVAVSDPVSFSASTISGETMTEDIRYFEEVITLTETTAGTASGFIKITPHNTAGSAYISTVIFDVKL